MIPDVPRTAETCELCRNPLPMVKRLTCKHAFCQPCIDDSLKKDPSCPTCGEKCTDEVHVQPPTGKVLQSMDKKKHLPGFEGQGTLELTFEFESGIQQVCEMQYPWNASEVN